MRQGLRDGRTPGERKNKRSFPGLEYYKYSSNSISLVSKARRGGCYTHQTTMHAHPLGGAKTNLLCGRACVATFQFVFPMSQHGQQVSAAETMRSNTKIREFALADRQNNCGTPNPHDSLSLPPRPGNQPTHSTTGTCTTPRPHSDNNKQLKGDSQ